MSRTLNRAIARKLYTDFAKQWRTWLRESGKYGAPRAPKRPTFSQWYAIHQRDASMMSESNPQDVQEYLEATAPDPWSEQKPGVEAESEGERGVVTIPIMGDE